MISASILGASGYTGKELVSLLSFHPHFKLTRVYSVSSTYQSLKEVNPLFSDVPVLPFDKESDLSDIDLLFLAIPHGEAHRFVGHLLEQFKTLKIVDLSADFRLRDASLYENVYGFKHDSSAYLDQAVMGIPELFHERLKTTRLCANPGCYAIAASLGLWPIKDVLDEHVLIDAKSGASGAGKKLDDTLLFCEVNESVSAYKTGTHRHAVEMAQNLGVKNLFFSPHLMPSNRGILCSMYVNNTKKWTLDDLFERYEACFSQRPFVCINRSYDVSTKPVIGTNTCMITLKMVENKIVVFSAIDNLLKGASGVAIQNANIMLGLDEGLGLRAC